MKSIGSIVADIVGNIEPPEIDLKPDELAKADIFDYPIAVFADSVHHVFHRLKYDYKAEFEEKRGFPLTSGMLRGRLGDGRRFVVILDAHHPRGTQNIRSRHFAGSIDLTVLQRIDPDVAHVFATRLVKVNA